MAVDLVVQVVMIAESMRLQAILATYGIQTQTPNEIEPVQIWSQWEMVKVYQLLGKNHALGLNGRPPRPMGVLGSSKVQSVTPQSYRKLSLFSKPYRFTDLPSLWSDYPLLPAHLFFFRLLPLSRHGLAYG